MSRQLRKNEIHRRQKRSEKLYKLRKKYKEAKSEEEKRKILEKVARIAPYLDKEKFLLLIKD